MARPAKEKPADWFDRKEFEGDNALQYRRNHPDFFTLSGVMRKDVPDNKKSVFELCVWYDEQGIACPDEDESEEGGAVILGPRTEDRFTPRELRPRIQTKKRVVSKMSKFALRLHRKLFYRVKSGDGIFCPTRLERKSS